MRRIIFFFTICFFSTLIFGLTYEIHCSLDPDEHTVRGVAEITWTNNAQVPVETLQFHLYPNAFESEKTTFLKGSSWLKSFWHKYGDERYSLLEIEDLRVSDGEEIPYHFISPDDGNMDDRTVMEAMLQEPLAPGAELKLHIEWVTHLSRSYLRSGYSRDYHQVMQWYPKLGVWTEDGWNCHQHHPFTEYFADFADYDVTIQLPEDYVLACTGEIISTLKGEERTKLVRIRQERIHDFGFVAAPDLQLVSSDYNPKGARPVIINLYLPDEYGYKQKRFMDVLKKSFDFYNEWVGPYPYSHFSVVVPPWHAFHGRTGMEYPTLIIAGTRHFSPRKSQDLEYLLVHEFGHQYFYGILASNEFEHPWLDEGFTTYTSSRMIEDVFGNRTPYFSFFDIPLPINSFPIHPFNDHTFRAYQDPHVDTIDSLGFKRANWHSYRVNSYARPARLLRTLENHIGTEKMIEFLRAYYARFAFTHPLPEDVLALVEEFGSKEWRTLFETVMTNPEKIDYRVDSISMDEVLVVREGPLNLPVQVRLTLSNGDTRAEEWDGVSRWIRFHSENGNTFTEAVVDPNGKICLDENPLNNAKSLKANRTHTRRFTARLLFWVQYLLEAVSCAY